MPKHFLLTCFLILFGLLLAGPAHATRDPKSDEMPAIQEIAYYLQANAAAVESLALEQAATNPAVRGLLPSLERLRGRAVEFYDRVLKNTKSPWRTASPYEELDRAFNEASRAFVSRPVYSLDPRAFEEIAYLMGALLSFYSEPVYSVTVYPAGGYAVYPRVVYPWIPAYYNFSRCRFANPNLYPWGRRVVFAPKRR